MDDIRNTSALFVGGQDTAPHTERTARELWQLLFQKTENEMAAYMNSLNQLPRSELIMAADEISAMATCSMKEAQIENLLLAKDFSDCVVYIGNGSITVAVPAPTEGLSAEAVARITDVICSETEYDASQLNIIEVKA